MSPTGLVSDVSSSNRSNALNFRILWVFFHPGTPFSSVINPLECRGNYSAISNNRKLGTLAVDGWAVTFGTARRGLGGLRLAKSPPRCTKCNSPPINGQCTNRRIAVTFWDFNVPIKGLIDMWCRHLKALCLSVCLRLWLIVAVVNVRRSMNAVSRCVSTLIRRSTFNYSIRERIPAGPAAPSPSPRLAGPLPTHLADSDASQRRCRRENLRLQLELSQDETEISSRTVRPRSGRDGRQLVLGRSSQSVAVGGDFKADPI